MLAAPRLGAVAGGPSPWWLVALAVASGLGIAAAATVASPLLVVGAVAVTLFAGIAVSRPLAGLVLILVFFASIVEVDVLPLVPVGIGSLNPIDLLLLAYLAVVVFRALWPAASEPAIAFGLVDLAVVAFMLLLGLSTLRGLEEGTTDIDGATNSLRVFGYYLTAVVVTHLFTRRRDLDRLVGAVLILAVAVSMAMIVQLFLGDDMTIVNGRVEPIAADDGGVTTRIIPGGRYLVLVGFWLFTALVGLLDGTRPLRYYLGWAATAIAVVLTFYRSFVVATAFVFVVMVVVAAPWQRRKLARTIGAALAVGIVVGAGALVAPASPAREVVNPFIDRVGSLGQPDTYGTGVDESSGAVGSLEFRRIENEYALERLRPPPLLGLGAGAAYRPFDDRIDSEEFLGVGYLHNGHLWVILRAGLLGYAALMIAYVVTACQGWRVWRRSGNPRDRTIGLVFALAVPALLAISVLDPAIADVAWTPLFGIIAGWTTVVARSLGGSVAPFTAPAVHDRASDADCEVAGDRLDIRGSDQARDRHDHVWSNGAVRS